jgi:hypothetical protein
MDEVDGEIGNKSEKKVHCFEGNLRYKLYFSEIG